MSIFKNAKESFKKSRQKRIDEDRYLDERLKIIDKAKIEGFRLNKNIGDYVLLVRIKIAEGMGVEKRFIADDSYFEEFEPITASYVIPYLSYCFFNNISVNDCAETVIKMIKK